MIGMLRRQDLRVHEIRHWVAASLLGNGVGVFSGLVEVSIPNASSSRNFMRL